MNYIILIILALIIVGVVYFVLKSNKSVSYKTYKHKYLFCKGFTHDEKGHVDEEHVKKFYKALENNDQKTLYEFELKYGKLIDPMSALSEPSAVKISYRMPDYPEYNTKEAGEDMINVYAMALARDVPFVDYDKNEYIDKLKKMLNFTQGSDKLFRLFDKSGGPYVSQLLLHDVKFSNRDDIQQFLIQPPISQAKIRMDYGIDRKEMVSIENLNFIPKEKEPRIPLYLFCGRSLANIVEFDLPFHVYSNAAIILNGLECPKSKQFPNMPINEPNGSMNGNISLFTMLGEATYNATIHAYFNKWMIFRRIRPELISLYIDNVKNNIEKIDFDPSLLNHPILEEIKAMNKSYGAENSYTLNMAFSDGSPTHPAYPSNHAVIAGACATILKLMFDTETPWTKLAPLIQANEDGTQLIPYQGETTTVGDEIEKLASNIANARSWAGVHFVFDNTEGIKLGEEVAIELMRKKLKEWKLKNKDGSDVKLSLKKFDGTKIIV